MMDEPIQFLSDLFDDSQLYVEVIFDDDGVQMIGYFGLFELVDLESILYTVRKKVGELLNNKHGRYLLYCAWSAFEFNEDGSIYRNSGWEIEVKLFREL